MAQSTFRRIIYTFTFSSYNGKENDSDIDDGSLSRKYTELFW